MFSDTDGQIVTIKDLPFDTISEINSANNHFIDTEIYPDWRKVGNLIEEKVYQKVDTSWWTSDIMRLVEDWKVKHNISDDGNVFYSYALFKKNSGEIVLQKIPLKVYYLFAEIGGGYKVERVIVPHGELVQNKILQDKRTEYQFNPEELHRPIICVFDTTINLTEKKVEQYDLTSKLPAQKQKHYFSYDNIVPKNISIQCELDRHVYEFDYAATLCNNGYNFNGYGTIRSTFYNIVLKFKSSKDNEEQIIYKTPDDSNYNISGIYTANINSDNIPDIILSVSSESGKWNLVYLSGDSGKLEYIGFTEVYVIDP